jgi:hypothetical protein
MREARTHRSNMSPEMSTENVGHILPQAWSVTAVEGRKGRAAYREPSEFTMGPNEDVGVGVCGDMIMPEDDDA